MKQTSEYKKAFVYPRFKPDENKNSNPYIQNVCDTLAAELIVSNANDYTYFETKDIIKHWSSDIFFFNWIEEIYRFRGGKIRVLLFLFVLTLLKTFGKTIVWTLHNKESHHSNSKWRRLLSKQIVRSSKLIITHSKEGVEYISSQFPEAKNKVHYICHPTRTISFETEDTQKEYDVLIWGAITPYKGICEFLETVNQSKISTKLRIAIVGKCLNDDYLKEIKKKLTVRTTFINQFLSIEEIANIAQKSEAILFTYQPESVLSSGSLMDSLAMKRPVIGPNVGAFSDLEKIGIIRTYKNKQELLKIIGEENNENDSAYKAKISEFLKSNAWGEFGNKILQIL